MKIGELSQYMKEECLHPFDDIESLVIRLIYDNKITKPYMIFEAIGQMYQKMHDLVDASASHINNLLKEYENPTDQGREPTSD